MDAHAGDAACRRQRRPGGRGWAGSPRGRRTAPPRHLQPIPRAGTVCTHTVTPSTGLSLSSSHTVPGPRRVVVSLGAATRVRARPPPDSSVARLGFVQAGVWREWCGGAAHGRDLCVCAPTGSGKTLAYALPVAQVGPALTPRTGVVMDPRAFNARSGCTATRPPIGARSD